jgi:hypothetical protein
MHVVDRLIDETCDQVCVADLCASNKDVASRTLVGLEIDLKPFHWEIAGGEFHSGSHTNDFPCWTGHAHNGSVLLEVRDVADGIECFRHNDVNCSGEVIPPVVNDIHVDPFGGYGEYSRGLLTVMGVGVVVPEAGVAVSVPVRAVSYCQM